MHPTPDSPRLLRKAQVAEATGLTVRTIDARVRAGQFPKPIAIDARQVRWVAAEVAEWIAARIADRDAGVEPDGVAAMREARRRGGLTRGAQLAARTA